MAGNSWTFDKSHSDITFKVKHLMISTVTGKFNDFTVALESDSADLSNAKMSFSISAASIDTGIDARDNHLRSDDFFNAEKFPQITFQSTSVDKKSDEHFVVHGDLTIRDVTKNIAFDVELGGSMKDPYGNVKVGYDVSSKIRRKEFNLLWDALTESGGVVVSDEVRLHASVQFVHVEAHEMQAA